jgi:hypothetical protein
MATTTTSTRSQRPPRLLATLALAALAAVVLGACGGGRSSNASSSVQSGSTATPTEAPATAAAGRPAKTSHPSGGPAKTEGSEAFRVASGDNSIPDFGVEAAVSERDRAATALAAYLSARARAQWSIACTYLTRQGRAQLESLAGASKGKVKGCTAVLGALEAHTPAVARADTFLHGLASLRVKGTRGFALYYGPHSQKYVVPLAREAGAWKITQLAPIPYPLDSPTPPAG